MNKKAWLATVLALIAGVGWLGMANRSGKTPGARAAAERPALAMLTSLPLLFGESFGLDAAGSPVLTRLERRYEVVPIAVADAASLKGHNLLLMAHPRAQPADALVELDRWVRGGGRMLLLADPRLHWPSQRPLGDVLRPPPIFADTGLLRHWGLALSSAGLASSGECRIADEGLVARCRVGRGRVTVIADADFLNVETPDDRALDPLDVELGRLETR